MSLAENLKDGPRLTREREYLGNDTRLIMSASKEYTLFIGRWQPFHASHRWLVAQELNKGVPALLAVRYTPVDTNNPLPTETVAQIRGDTYQAEIAEGRVAVITIPDIESVNYGWDVGYAINAHVPPPAIAEISALCRVRFAECGYDSNA